MRHIATIYALSFGFAAAACAQSSSQDRAEFISGSSEGTIVCKSEKAMVTLMKTRTAMMALNLDILHRLEESGDCFAMPRGWLMLEAQDPPLDQQEDHAAKLVVRTPDGIVHMWGTPFGGD
ncbi:hypothetical protein EO087_13965 [Dyella sp. M7H15-1]|uniref:hypothetical protein n=1 Tax=Dyella sp. M7H15-1 TaxID=2501295 RepID=UPI001004DBA3|nr:hypothetical protein [Dyella sp. M7H15-1]QAU24962.1 hypothetical protein EO087_13965 [Dyella sp. M7H15-1]